jgi:asparagine synthase (glutamine-hydrolysing)
MTEASVFMCGIYGLIQFNSSSVSREETLVRMGNVIEHRGPDDHGHFLAPGVGLGMRRLSIIDVAGGHQPIANEDESVWIVLNGEIYNFKELHARLEQKGHRFRTRTDTEVIVHLYEEVGLDLFKHLRGMFGLALWDVKRERLVLGRDRIGEKPLFVRREPGRFLFASELKSILQAGDVPRRLNTAALEEYLALGYVPAPLTLLEGIEKLLPGHYLVVEKDSVEDHEYWDVPRGKTEHRSEHEWIEIVREKLLETIGSQLVSDVPLGAFLSGGIDSSTIVAGMARLTGRPVKTYSIGYESGDNYYNELSFAKTVANAFGTDHHEIIVRPQVSDLLPKLIWHLDEPIADSACLTTYLVSRLASESVKVILSGVGGDELFGGYRRYLGNSLHRFYKFLPGPVRRSWLPALLSYVPQDRGAAWKDYARYASAFVKTAELAPAQRYMSYVTLFSPQAQQDLLVRDHQTGSNGDRSAAATLQEYFARCPDDDDLNRIIYADLKTSLPDDLLALTDRMSMAASIECRAPFVDYELIELASRIPSSMKIRGFNMKYLLKKAVAPWLPREVIHRKKRGFGAPVGSWLRQDLQPLIHELLSEEQVRKRGLMHWPAVENILKAHQEQRGDYTDHLFALLSLETWCRIYLDGLDWKCAPPSLVEHGSLII